MSTPSTDTSFGNTDDLATILGKSFATLSAEAQAEAALAYARGVIRALTGQHISLVTGDEHVMDWDGGASVFMPELPVSDVASVEGHDPMGDDPSAWVEWPTAFTWSMQTGELRLFRPQWPGWWWSWPPDTVGLQALRITYDHGFDPVPAELVGVLYGLAGRQLASPSGQVMRSETIGAYSYTTGDQVAPAGTPWGAGLTGAESAVLARYKVPNRG